MPADKPLRIMVSSAVYGIENLLNQIFATLEGYGYDVWMSYKGTIPTDPRFSNFDNCERAVDSCDLFLGIITGRYGSGKVGRNLSILHREIRRAIQKNKLRWFLVHRDVTIARELLKQFRFRPDGGQRHCRFQPTAVLQDLRVLDMYEEAILHETALSDRRGNWAQEYFTPDDSLRFIKANFCDPARVRRMLAGEEAASW